MMVDRGYQPTSYGSGGGGGGMFGRMRGFGSRGRNMDALLGRRTLAGLNKLTPSITGLAANSDHRGNLLGRKRRPTG